MTKLPSREEGHAAHLHGQDDAIAGVPRGQNPWDVMAADTVTRALALCYLRGYNYGHQVRLQRKYGDPPTD